MMAITERASAWLATLSREPALSTTDVERLIVDAGHTPHAVWLDFHERYGGYIEGVGPGDLAVWGLARVVNDRSRVTSLLFYKSNHVYYIAPQTWFPEAIMCADTNPVHGYELGSDGHFYGPGGPAATFEMKLERHGLMHEFHSRGGDLSRRTVIRAADEPQHQELLQQVATYKVDEASDKVRQYFFDSTRLVEYSPPHNQLIIWELNP